MIAKSSLNPLLCALPALALLALGCENRATTDGGYAPPSLPDVRHPGETPEATDEPPQNVAQPTDPGDDSKVEDPVDWVEAPAGHCEDPDHLAVVTWVKDGDTVQIDWPHPTEKGKKASVRYIGVAAAEVDECWGTEGTEALQSLTPFDGLVCLQQEKNSANYDMFGRYLRWVFIQLEDGRWVLQNQRLVRLGEAQAYHQYLKGRIYEAEIKAAEGNAKAESRGGWNACGW